MNAIHNIRLSVLILFIFTIGFGSSNAATHVVLYDGTGDYATIQDAIDAVASGDTIYLGDGTFTGTGNKDLDPAGKNLVIMPLPGALPVIDCEDSGRAFYIHSGEDASMVIQGLTLTGGNPPGGTASKGGAILIESASPTITDNNINENQSYFGAGIHMDDSNSLILRNQFINNTIKEITVSWGYGGGIYAANSTLTIYDNHFEQTEFSFWEAMYILSGTVSIENNSITGFGWMDSINNIIADSSDVTIVGNHIQNSGGCIWFFHCTATVRANYFQNSNTLAGYGGVFASNSTVDIGFNYFEDVSDGAVDWAGSTGDIYRNVITGSNVRSLDYGARAVYITGSPQPTIFNNTFYENGTTGDPGCTSGTDIHIDGTTGVVYSNIFVNSVALDCAVVCGPPPWATARKAPARQYGNGHWGNTEESFFIFCDGIVSVLVTPVLCDPDNDNFFLTDALPNDSTLMGALPPGCFTSDVLLTEVPPDDSIGISVAPEHIVLSGFSFTNLSNFSAPVNYRLFVSGPARLDDNGDPSSLAGSTPELDAGDTWTPPSARLILGVPASPGQITVKYVTAYAPALAIPETTRTSMLIFDDATTVKPGQGGYRTALEQNFPNPSNPATTIAFSLEAASKVKLMLYDVRGRFIKTLAGGIYSAGQHSVMWDGSDRQGQSVASGVYFYRMEAGTFTDTKKLILLK
jgi:hypothetical protein